MYERGRYQKERNGIMKRVALIISALAAIVSLALLSAAPAATGSQTGGVRVSAASSSLGKIIVAGGRTLYLFEKDKRGHSACSGACAIYWPPLITHGKPIAGPGAKSSLLGTIRRANGSRQVTYAGHALYRYVGDTRPGQTNGEGSQEFGAGWDALSPAGKKIERDG
jgi:predicted lipoprotein with Yx(FWY)xxD motif